MSEALHEREQRILEEFDRVLDVPAAERLAFVRRRFAADPSLVRELERLIAAAARDDGLLDLSAGAAARGVMDDLRESAAVTLDVPAELRASLAPRFVIEDRVGSGGMATVYLAFDTVLTRLVAVKALRPDLAHTLSADRFELEISIAAKLDHPRIVPIYDRGLAAGVLYYMMRHVGGGSLRDKLDVRKTLDIAECIAIARHVAEALDYAHAHQVVHRDIKPENILLDDSGAYVADFGVARLLDAAGREQLTQTGMAIGTVLYMSPEQAEPGRAVTGRSDVYALACVMYEMLAGEPPFTGGSQREVLMKHMVESIPDLSAKRVDVTLAMQRALAAGLHKEEESRAATACALVNAFEQAWRSWDPPGMRPAAKPASGQTIAVLPFANMSGDPANDYLGDGIAQDLITALTRAGGLRVVARGSSFAPNLRNRDVRDVGAKLGATHLLEGSVRTVGRRLRATTQLVDTASGNLLWSERYDRDLEDVFAVQDEITGAIVRRLHEELAPRPTPGQDSRFGSWRVPTTKDTPTATRTDDLVFLESGREKLEPPAPVSRAMEARYDILGEIGQGGMSTVYLARDVGTHRKVAIKTLRPEVPYGDSIRRRFLREGSVAKKLVHPNIMEILAVEDTETSAYVVMPYVEGRALDAALHDGPFAIDAALAIVVQVAGALSHAHSKGIIHRDVRPANIMLDKSGKAIVMEFGALVLDSGSLTATGTILGTPMYMAPEVFHGKVVGPAADQYALGCVAYQMLANEPPFTGGTFSELITGHLYTPPKDVRLTRPDVPEHVATAIQRMMAKDPADRFASMDAARKAFGALSQEANAAVAALATSGPFRKSRVIGSAGARAGFARSSASSQRVIPASAPRSRSVGATAGVFASLLAALRRWWRGDETPVVPPTPRVERLPEAQLGDGLMMGVPSSVLSPTGMVPGEQTILRRKFPAYDEYLRGRFLLNFESRAESLDEAIRHFGAAIAGNEKFAPAWAARAQAQIMLERLGAQRDYDVREAALRDAEMAITLDPKLAEAHVAKALVAIFVARDASSAMDALAEATQRSPTYADAHLWRGYVFNWLRGDPDRAIASLDRAMDLDPLSLSARVELAFAYWMKGELPDARTLADEAVETGRMLGAKPRADRSQPREAPDGFAAAHYVRAVVLAAEGRLGEALADAQEAVRVGGEQPAHVAFLGKLRAATSGDEARAIARSLKPPAAG